jgi:hypothetical protein
MLVTPVALVCFLPCLTGCEQRVSQDAYDKITMGMSIGEVVSIMGSNGSERTQGASGIAAGHLIGIPGAKKPPIPLQKTIDWSEERRIITVIFEDGKVVEKNKDGF